jgi:hypothetical protein
MQLGLEKPMETALKAQDKGSSGGSGAKEPKQFKGNYYNYGKIGYIARNCSEPEKPIVTGFTGAQNDKTNPSTGPLPTPGGNRRLSPPAQALQAVKQCWTITIGGTALT